MPKIFISYRRDDGSGQAGRLFDHLSRRFGEDSVFMDVDTIDLGRDFKPALQEAVRKCDIMLVVVGRDWLDCTDPKTGARRLENADDWVRVEIAEALRRNIPVIPVLVRGAAMFASDQLPGDISELAHRQAAAISDDQWRAGVSNLIERLQAIPRRRERELAETQLARFGLKRLAGLVTGSVLILLAAAWMLWPAQAVEVPSVTGKPLADARSAIEAAGLKLVDGGVQEEESLTEKAGTVIRQDPSAGLRVSKRDGVKLVVAKVAPPVDLSPSVRIRNVGNDYTIAAVAGIVAIEAALSSAGRSKRLSERYLYEKARRHDGSKADEEGTWFEAIVYVAERFGVAPYEMWPYKVGDRTLPRGFTWEQLDAAAAQYKFHSHRVAAVEGIYEQLRRGRPVLAAVKLTDEWINGPGAKTGHIAVDPSAAQSYDDNGTVTFVGFDPATETLRFANNWGEEWGDKGFGTMSIETARAVVLPQRMWAVEAAASN